jgi:hypothetical protein
LKRKIQPHWGFFFVSPKSKMEQQPAQSEFDPSSPLKYPPTSPAATRTTAADENSNPNPTLTTFSSLGSDYALPMSQTGLTPQPAAVQRALGQSRLPMSTGNL